MLTNVTINTTTAERTRCTFYDINVIIQYHDNVGHVRIDERVPRDALCRFKYRNLYAT